MTGRRPESERAAAPELAARGVINCVAYREGRRVAPLEIEAIPAALEDPTLFVWLGLFEPDEALMARVQRAFGLHDLAVEDAHRAHQRPKLERFGESLFLVLRTAHFADGGARLAFGETHVFLGRRSIVTVRHGSLTSHVDLRTRCEARPDALALGPGYVLHALFDFHVDQYFPVLDELEEQFERIETDVFDGRSERATTENLYELRRDLLQLRRAIYPLIDVCLRLERHEDELVPQAIRVYLRDVHDHVLRIHEMLEGLRELSASALEAHLSLLSISQGEDTRKLAAWAAIVAVPTMVAGIYGMNFQYMPELTWRLGYPLVLAGTLGVCGLLFRAFKRSGWL